MIDYPYEIAAILPTALQKLSCPSECLLVSPFVTEMAGTRFSFPSEVSINADRYREVVQ